MGRRGRGCTSSGRVRWSNSSADARWYLGERECHSPGSRTVAKTETVARYASNDGDRTRPPLPTIPSGCSRVKPDAPRPNRICPFAPSQPGREISMVGNYSVARLGLPRPASTLHTKFEGKRQGTHLHSIAATMCPTTYIVYISEGTPQCLEVPSSDCANSFSTEIRGKKRPRILHST